MSWLLYAVGWTCGWLLLWSTRALPAARSERAAVAVIVPARDEATALPHLLGSLVGQLADGDELVVVDDHSADDTAAVAATFGVRVVEAPDLPAGWVGKPHACWTGAAATTAPGLVFVDADVRAGRDLLGGVAAAVAAQPGVVVSVQPWHDAERPPERASVLPSIVALMGSGGFTILGRRLSTDVAYGPVLALDRAVYDRIGGHAHPSVRTSLTEDIALARAAGGSALYTSRVDATFRMYPRGLTQLVAGWSRTMADGMAATRWWVAIAVAAWVWSLAGGPFAGWPAYPLTAVQVWVLGRRAGRFGPVTAALYPVAVVVLVVIILRACWNRARGVTSWKGRSVPAT